VYEPGSSARPHVESLIPFVGKEILFEEWGDYQRFCDSVGLSSMDILQLQKDNLINVFNLGSQRTTA